MLCYVCTALSITNYPVNVQILNESLKNHKTRCNTRQHSHKVAISKLCTVWSRDMLDRSTFITRSTAVRPSSYTPASVIMLVLLRWKSGSGLALKVYYRENAPSTFTIISRCLFVYVQHGKKIKIAYFILIYM